MENFRFTLFNDLTLLILALTLAMAVVRAKAPPTANWPLTYYAVLLGFALGFPYSFNLWAVVGGIVSALLVRLAPQARPAARIAEFAALAYVFGRSVALLLMW
jgi:dolichyl-phosphate-mannose--protein O-mannosyl transferase